MGTIVLIIVVAAWGAVLVPPLMRGRSDNSPHSSVLDFRRQLSTLQRSAPIRPGAPMRSMARPLAPSPSRAGRPDAGYDRHLDPSAALRRTVHSGHTAPRGISRKAMVRQRRQNVLVSLALTTVGSAFIAFTTKSDLFVYVFVLATLSLIGYCYRLSQLRRYSAPQAYRRDWIRAA
jgi:hypothetical protein